ncbi:hypothetical protein ABZ484_25730 [Streptomyces sp. NPDC006393]|uniref:SCO2400 family protein n=1 Tax=Streptomyces sp. NPDC006393 TaxID=3156763 RepID=UPI00340F2C88
MNYCHPCRRHLNGALACPGCGTPAEALHEYADAAPAEPVELPAQEREFADGAGDSGDGSEEPLGRADRRRGRGRGRGTPEEDRQGPVASRRDRKAAAHRRRRRRTLLIGAGFVLAAGGLSLAELGTDAPILPGFSSPEPAAAGDETADGGATSPGASGTAWPPGGTPGGGTAARKASATTSASPSASAKDEKPEPDESASGSPRHSAPATRGAGTGGGSGTTVAPPRPSSTPTPPPATSDPRPSPTPTATHTKCERFLWWCT